MLSHWRLKSSLTCNVTFWAALTSWTVACVDWHADANTYLHTWNMLTWLLLTFCCGLTWSSNPVLVKMWILVTRMWRTLYLLSRMRILDISGDGDNTLEFLLLSWCKSWWNSSRRILIHHENQTETLFVQKSTRKCPINASFLSQSKWNFQHSSQQAPVSVMFFGFCHLILFVSSTNYF